MADLSPYSGIGWNPPQPTQTTGIDFSTDIPNITPAPPSPSSTTTGNSSNIGWGYNSGLIMPVANYTGVLPWQGSASIGAPRTGHTHQGIDMKAYTGQPLVAVIDGKIESVHSSTNGGKIVWLRGADGRLYKYMHCSEFKVSKGQTVVQGQVLALAGATGNASGPHLHFEVWDADGKMLNPSAVLSNSPNVSGGDVIYSDDGGSTAVKTTSAADEQLFWEYMNRAPTAAEKSRMVNEGWDQNVLRRYAAENGGDGPRMLEMASTIRQIGAGFYHDDPSAVPASIVNALIAGGYSISYIRDTYFPSLRGGSMDNPLSVPYIDMFVEMTGRPMTYTAKVILDEIIKVYGYGPEAEAAWSAKIKTFDSAASGNWGASHRAAITDDITMLLGRNPVEQELAVGGPFWDMNADARYEAIRATPEYQAIYAGKPAWMNETDFVDAALGFNDVMRWYYGDHVVQNPDGSFTIPTGEYYQTPNMVPAPTGYTRAEDPNAVPDWKSLNNAQWASDLRNYGITFADGKYTKDGAEISADNVLSFLPENTYYRDEAGFHYVQQEGAIDPRTGKPTTGPTIPRSAAPATQVPGVYPGLNQFGVSYVNGDIVSDFIMGGYTPQQLRQEFAWQEEAAYMSGIYGDTMTEAFGGDGGVDWYTVASGAKGSGAMRAKLVEAQNRVAYREAYRQVFGSDPGPSDYDRITNEFVSPSELIREHQAIESADEMYDEVNDLLQRVYGGGVSKDELKDMVLGRPNSGELKALINQATKLDQYTWMHKQYYDSDPTPADYAKYAGYTGPAELQWEIVTTEKIAEMKPEISEAWNKVYPDDPMLSDDELWTLYGEQQGYGDLRAKVKDVMKQASEKEQAEDWMYNGAEQAEQAYRISEQGGFRGNAPGLAEL